MAMLVAATTIFLYYTLWTLLMVRYLTCSSVDLVTDPAAAIRGRRSSSSKPLPSTRLGHSNPSHPHSSRVGSGRNILGHGDDQEQQKEGCKSPSGCSEEDEMNVTGRSYPCPALLSAP